MYSKKEVVELFNDFKEENCSFEHGSFYYDKHSIPQFLKEKGLIEQFEVGKWWKQKIYNGDTYYMCLYELRCGSWYFYGIIDGKWGKSSVSTYDMKKWERMTNEEVEEALIKECDKFKGKKVKCIFDGIEYSIWQNPKYWYNSRDNHLGVEFAGGDKCVLFHNGDWAEIVEDKKEEIDLSVLKMRGDNFKGNIIQRLEAIETKIGL